jgi:hypothetical protein
MVPVARAMAIAARRVRADNDIEPCPLGVWRGDSSRGIRAREEGKLRQRICTAGFASVGKTTDQSDGSADGALFLCAFWKYGYGCFTQCKITAKRMRTAQQCCDLGGKVSPWQHFATKIAT